MPSDLKASTVGQASARLLKSLSIELRTDEIGIKKPKPTAVTALLCRPARETSCRTKLYFAFAMFQRNREAAVRFRTLVRTRTTGIPTNEVLRVSINIVREALVVQL